MLLYVKNMCMRLLVPQIQSVCSKNFFIIRKCYEGNGHGTDTSLPL